MSKKHPISLCMICKNEEGNIENCLRSIREFVDEIVLVDTGSTDKTPELAAPLCDKFEVYTECNGPDGKILDFSMARNRSFSLATHDWVMWIDADDVVRNPQFLPELLERYSSISGPRMIMLPYEYSRDAAGNVNCLHYRERIFYPRSEFAWKNPVHEICSTKTLNPTVNKENCIVIDHRRTQSGKTIDPNRNLNILKKYYEKHGESDVRQLYYLGLEYANVGNVGSSLNFHKRYLELSGWDEEKFMSCLEIVKHYQGMGDYDNALEWALESLKIREGWAESYFALCRIYYFMAERGGPEQRRNWERCVYYGQVGLSLPPTQTILFINPMERAYDIHRYLNLALSKIGKVEEAYESVRAALKVCPDDPALLSNGRIYKTYLLKQRITDSVDELIGGGELDSSVKPAVVELLEKKPSSLEAVSKPTVTASDVVTRAEPTSYQTKHPKEIAIYVGYSPTPWSPATILEGGYGGSEIMAWEMSRQLSLMGHDVRVYGDCKDLEGLYDGVRFLHYEKFKGVSADVCISSRRPNAFDDAFGVRSKVNICWVHDVNCWDLNHARALRVDKFFALSDWHRDYFLKANPFIHPTQVIKTRNGVRLDRFKPDANGKFPVRNPHRAIYSSSPDRGLQAALDSWHIVRSQVPDAELHVFYGFDSWLATARLNNDASQINLIEHLQRLIQSRAGIGVVSHGRVGQYTLAREFMSSGVWAYPTWFSETSCITAMEAQAAGLRIVTSPIAALNETVGGRGKMIQGDWLDPQYQKAWAEGVIEAMTADDSDGVRERNRNYAQSAFCMERLGCEWDNMLHDVMLEVEENVVPKYTAVG